MHIPGVSLNNLSRSCRTRIFTLHAIFMSYIVHCDRYGLNAVWLRKTLEERGSVMRIHSYAAGAGGAVTHPDIAGEMVLKDLIVIETDEVVYRVGDGLEIDIERTVVEIFGELPGHVITHPCRSITVAVSYTGREVDLKVHPATLVKQVQAEAIEAFKMDTGSAAELELRLPGASTELAPSHPIGSYVAKGTCKLTVDLVHVVRPQG